MPKLSTYIDIEDYCTGELVQIYLPDVCDLGAVDSSILDGSDDISTEICEIMMEDGSSYFVSCSLSFAIDLYRNIMRFKLAKLMNIKLDKLYVN